MERFVLCIIILASLAQNPSGQTPCQYFSSEQIISLNAGDFNIDLTTLESANIILHHTKDYPFKIKIIGTYPTAFSIEGGAVKINRVSPIPPATDQTFIQSPASILRVSFLLNVLIFGTLILMRNSLPKPLIIIPAIMLLTLSLTVAEPMEIEQQCGPPTVVISIDQYRIKTGTIRYSSGASTTFTTAASWVIPEKGGSCDSSACTKSYENALYPCDVGMMLCNGFCVDSGTNQNCGGCDISCGFDFYCFQNNCVNVNQTCTTSVVNCDNDLSNGCETNLLTDDNNCGACRRSCIPFNASPDTIYYCNNGTCNSY